MQRSLRTGAGNYAIDRVQHRSNLVLITKNLGSLLLSPVRATKVLLATGRLLPATHPVLVSLGRIMASLGFSPVPYRADMHAQASLTSAP